MISIIYFISWLSLEIISYICYTLMYWLSQRLKLSYLLVNQRVLQRLIYSSKITPRENIVSGDRQISRGEKWRVRQGKRQVTFQRYCRNIRPLNSERSRSSWKHEENTLREWKNVSERISEFARISGAFQTSRNARRGATHSFLVAK